MKTANHDQNQHDFELAYQAFRDRYGELFDSLDQAQLLCRWGDAPTRDIDPRVNFPLDLTTTMVDAWHGKRPTASEPEFMLGQFLHAFGNYGKTRTIYTIDRTLFSHLVGSRWPKDIPMSAAFLPKNGCVLDLPAHEVFGAENIQGGDRVCVVCTYDMNYDTGDLDLVLTAMSHQRRHGEMAVVSLDRLHAWVNMASANLEEAILDYAIYMDEATKRLQQVAEKSGDPQSDIPGPRDTELRESRLFSTKWQRYLKAILSVVLYINGNDDLLEVKDIGNVPMNRAARRRLAKQKPNGRIESVPLQQYLVGRKFASCIQRWAEEEREESVRTGQSVRPHLRAAHAHKYRVGPGRSSFVVRFLPPIPVKGWVTPEEVPACRLVR